MLSAKLVAGLTRAAVAIALAVFCAKPAAAQDPETTRGWQAGLWFAGGYQWPTGRLAKHAPSDNPNLNLLEVVSDLGPSPLVSGGLLLRFPDLETAVRIGLEGSSGAEASGQVAICDLVSGRICAPEVVPAEIRAVTAGVRVLTGDAAAQVRPVLSAGLGVRRFAFVLPDCPPASTDDAALICNAVTELFRDPDPHLFLQVGLGLQTDVGPVAVGMDAVASSGQFGGGSDRTDGNWYHALRFELFAGASLY
ncbi:MAG: hypothetical protein OXH49_10020 [Gemmatimonadetes bacterium]|nr:hypothetical protein [Gemmatimonadota bacterium]